MDSLIQARVRVVFVLGKVTGHLVGEAGWEILFRCPGPMA